ncbi:MAG: hypothetical protein ABEJ28_10010 [Salinigranum sp.]
MTVSGAVNDDTTRGVGDEPGERAAGGESGGTLSRDEIFHVLQNRRRRDVLRYLQGRHDAVDLSDLAEQVAAWEHDTTVDALTSKERKRVYVALYQAHLPKLDDNGLVEYDQQRGTLRRTERADLLDPYLPPLDAREGDGKETPGNERAHAYYLAASALGGLLLSLAGLDAPVFGALTGFHVAAIVLATFVAITLGLLATERGGSDSDPHGAEGDRTG